MSPIKVAVIGYGLSAKIFHIPFIKDCPQLFTLHSILQRTPKPGNDAGKDFRDVKTFTELEPLLADPEVDLVAVCSIHSTHYAMCSAALNAGKHVICEKPLVATSKEALELAALAKEKGKVLAVYQNRRWDADFVTLSRLVREGVLGRIVEFESHFDRHRPDAPRDPAVAGWKAKADPTAGAIYDLGTHLIDQYFALFGMPDRVTGFITNQRTYEVEGTGGAAGGDSFTALLHYDKLGMLGTVKAASVSAESDEQLRYWVRGTKGTFKKYNLDPQEDQLKAGLRPGDEGYGIEDAALNGTLTTVDPATKTAHATKVEPEMPPQTYSRYYQLLAKAINEGAAPPVSATENAQVLRVIELAKQSSAEERTVKVDM